MSCVKHAIQALKPELVVDSERNVRPKRRNRRWNRARIRQGEWFFVPDAEMNVPEMMVLHSEPLLRSRGGKPHVCEELFRVGGQTVYVRAGSQESLSESEYRNLSQAQRSRWNWRVMSRDPRVYVRGSVRHADHATVILDGWHRVLSNRENESFAMRNIAFLD